MRQQRDGAPGTRPGPRAPRPDSRTAFQQLRAGHVGSGTLHDHGRAGRFSLAGAGVGGLGAATTRAPEQGFDRRPGSGCPGEDVQLRRGATLSSGSHEMWRRHAGVERQRRAECAGPVLRRRADAVIIRMA